MLAELDSNSEYLILFNLNPARISKYDNSIPKTVNKVYPLTVEDLYYQYKDSDGVDTVVMKVFKQVKDKVINGYLIVYGTISPSI